MMPLGSWLLLFFLAEPTEKLWEEKVLSSHIKEKGHKSRETLNISKVALRWSNSKETILWKENFLRNLISISSACVFFILKRDASCHHQGQQSYCTGELAAHRGAGRGGKHLIEMGLVICRKSIPPFPVFLRAWTRSRYSVYILGGPVCAPKTFNVSLFQAFPSCSRNLRRLLSKEEQTTVFINWAWESTGVAKAVSLIGV